ncbi:MAG: NAD-dependent epimerase/dehydratase family protein [Myxococcota bacterium]|nr:NAD-dependent epimerase/dehydratase family protein [Myxococcota bacterium]
MIGPRCVALTGLNTFVGQRLAERLLALPEPPRLVGIDLRQPLDLEGRIAFRPLDLTRATADGELATMLADEHVEAVVHLAFRSSPTANLEYDHELETLGSLHVMHACSAAKVGRLVLASSTMLYGPDSTNPNFLHEERALGGHADAPGIQNRVEAEGLLAHWAPRHPDVQVCVLRHCWVMGPTYSDHVVRYFDRPVVPVVLGYDPLMQFIHEGDLVSVFEKATLESHPGVYNVVGRGVVPLSMLLALAGKRSLPLPGWLLHRMPSVHSQGQAGDLPEGFFDYLRHLWVADGERGWQAFGEPVYTTKEAWISFVSSRRTERFD